MLPANGLASQMGDSPDSLIVSPTLGGTYSSSGKGRLATFDNPKSNIQHPKSNGFTQLINEQISLFDPLVLLLAKFKVLPTISE